MIIIGELINASRKSVGQAVATRDESFIQDLARKQASAGATYIDVNAGTLTQGEPEALAWLVETVQAAVEAPLCIDSPNPAAIAAALKLHKGKALINSITAEKARYDAILPLVKEHEAAVVALCMDDSGMPETAEDRLRVVDRLWEGLTKAGVRPEDIFFDPLVKPIGVDTRFGMQVLDTIREIHLRYPGAHTTCGLSNISFGLPHRKLLNRAFLIACMTCGLDSAVLDPLDADLMALLIATRAVLGRDQYCKGYITAYRQGRLG